MGRISQAFGVLTLLLVTVSCAPAHNPVIVVPGAKYSCKIVRPVYVKAGDPDINAVEIDAGLAGSVLEARLNRTDTPSWYCSKQHDWEVEWLSVKAVSRPDCLLDELTINYDPDTRRLACALPLLHTEHLAVSNHVIHKVMSPSLVTTLWVFP